MKHNSDSQLPESNIYPQNKRPYFSSAVPSMQSKQGSSLAASLNTSIEKNQGQPLKKYAYLDDPYSNGTKQSKKQQQVQVLSFNSEEEDVRAKSYSKYCHSKNLTLSTQDGSARNKQTLQEQFDSSKESQLKRRQLLFNPQAAQKKDITISTYLTGHESIPSSACNRTYNSNTKAQEAEVVHLNNEQQTDQRDDVQVTDSSWIDWDDQQKLEQLIKKQNLIEDVRGFDPQNYFGGIKVNDLNDLQDDSRLSDMFKDEMEEFSRLPATRAELLSTIKDKASRSQVQQPEIKTTVPPKHLKGAPLSPQKTPLAHSSLITPTYLLMQSLNQNSAHRSQAQPKGPQPQRSNSKIFIQTNDKRIQQGEYQINSIPQKNSGGQQQRGSSRTKAPTKTTVNKQYKALASVNSSNHTPSSSQVNISKSAKKLTYLTQNTSPQPTSKVFNPKQASVNASLSQLSKLRQCLSANTSPVRTLNKAPKPQQGSPVIASFKKIQQNIKQQRQLSPSSQVKETMATSNQDNKSPRTHVSSAANKYMKNASKLQSLPQLGTNATQSHLQKIKSFLSPAACQMKSQRTLIQNSSLARSLNSTKNKSRPTSQERICIDLSQNNLNTHAFKAASSPQPSPQWKSLMKTSPKQHQSRDHHSNNQQSLNSAVYETLVMQKTSMLKKTTSGMGGTDIENIPSKMNSQKSKVSDYIPIQNLKKGSNLRTTEKSGQKSAATLRVNLASTQNRSKLRTALCSSACSSYKV